MEQLHYPGNLPSVRRVAALGFFDGIHLGHRTVLRRALDVAGNALTPTVFTFDTLPKLQDGGRLLSREERDRRLSQMGFSECIIADFVFLRNFSPEEFVKTVLVDALQVTAVCCGENFRFGKNGAGDVAALKRWGDIFGFDVHILPLTPVDGEPVSSTRIRRALAAGDMLTVNRLLGHPYEITATVVDGAHLGRTFGTPTINQQLPVNTAYPPFGVYASAVEVDGTVHHAVTNIGIKPTVGGNTPLAETWIFDYRGNLYGQTVTVRPVRFLRAEQTFASVEELKAQIVADGEAARAVFAPTGRTRAILFDFDDTLQNRQEAFLNYSRAFIRHHFPARSAEEQEAAAQKMAKFNGSGYGFPSYSVFYRELIRLLDWQDAPDVEKLVRDSIVFFPEHTVLLPRVAEGLAALRERGYIVGMITNGVPFMQNKKLDVSGVRSYFDLIIISGEEDVSKPHPEIFRRAAARLGVHPADCVFVGDHPINDIQGAVEAGMTPLFMQASGDFPTPDGVRVVHSMDELIASV